MNHRGKHQPQRHHTHILVPVELARGGSRYNRKSRPWLALRVQYLDETLTGDSRRYVLRIMLSELSGQNGGTEQWER